MRFNPHQDVHLHGRSGPDLMKSKTKGKVRKKEKEKEKEKRNAEKMQLAKRSAKGVNI